MRILLSVAVGNDQPTSATKSAWCRLAAASSCYGNGVVQEPEASSTNWRPAVTVILCAIGLGLSIYTLWVHYHPSALSCPLASGSIDCRAVLTSAQSVIFGIPVPVFGLVFFLGLGALCLPDAWRSTAAWIHWLRLIGVIAGIGTVVYLVSTELFTVKKICLWCTGVHVVTFALFVIVITGTPTVLERSGSRG